MNCAHSEPRRRRHVYRNLMDALERRTLLSAYTYSTLAAFDGLNGSTPFGNELTVDSHGDLFGTTQEGGANNSGLIFEIPAATNTIVPIASFAGGTGPSNPVGNLLIDSAGNIFGAAGGGVDGFGTVYVIPHGTHSIATIATFDGSTEGAFPIGLAEDSAGNLYGVTQNGGTGSDGTVFEIPKGSGTLALLATFDAGNGSVPEGNLLIDSAGNIFGTTEQGGAGNGTVFEIPASAGSLTTLAAFNSSGTNGSEPFGDLVMDAQGDLFGTAQFGGISDAGPNTDGMVFELAKGSGTITPVAEFTQDTGYNPFTGLLMDAAGNLFGTTSSGGINQGGTIFEVPAGTDTLSIIASLPGPNGNVASGLAIDSAGDLFGLTEGDEIPSDLGTVFELSPTQATHLAFSAQPAATVSGQTLPDFSVEVLDSSGRVISSDDSAVTLTIVAGPTGVSFSGATTVNAIDGVATFTGVSISPAGHYTLEASDGTLTAASSSLVNITPSPLTALAPFDTGTGGSPVGNLVMDSHGDLFGTTSSGGQHGDGEIYELAFGAGTLTPLAAFSTATGTSPVGALVMDSAGDLFGVAKSGGENSSGTVFELPAGSGTITALASFTGAVPTGGLVMDSSGNFFGITTTGGGSSDGTLFELAASSGTITTLASFTGITWSTNPGPPVMDSAGDLIGATPTGGRFGDGTIFEFFASSQALSTVASFSGGIGITPQSLVADSAGNIYGITTSGGANSLGTLFILPAGSANVGVLASFDSSTGSPISMGADSHGNLVGAASADGGTLFEFPADSGSITAVAAMDSSTGTSPVGVFVDAAGNLFGIANSGGQNGTGTVFRLALAPANHIAITAVPVSGDADQNLSDITVAVEDADGYPITSDDSSVTLSIVSGPQGAVLVGDATAVAQGGVATFSGLSLPVAGTYTLIASNGILPVATSESFIVNPGAATQLAFTASPSDSGAGGLGVTTVAVEDAEGNIVTSDQSTVTLSVGGDNGTLLGTLSEPAVNGVATFGDLAIDTPGTFTLLASDGGLGGATTNSFVITPATASQLAFTIAPSSVVAGGLGTVVVAREDAFGNVISSGAASLVTLSLSAGGPLGGTLMAHTAQGIADFTDLFIEAAGTYTLTASAQGLSAAVSDSFVITPIAPAVNSVKLAFSVRPSNATAGSTLGAFAVTIEDSHGRITSDDSDVTLSIASGPNGSQLLGSYVVPAENGLASFRGISLQTAGTYTLFASDTTLGTATSAKFVILPAAPAQLTFVQNPANAAAGTVISPAVSVAVTDAFGNLVTNSKAAIALVVDTHPDGASLKGTVSAALKGGIATFNNLSLTTAGTYTLQAAGFSLVAVSQSFAIAPAVAAKLVFLQQPVAAAPGANITPAIAVAVEDRFGNIATGSSSVVTLSISSGPHGGSLTGASSATVQNGVAVFDFLALPVAGTYKLKASGAGLSAVSGSFVIAGAVGALPGFLGAFWAPGFGL